MNIWPRSGRQTATTRWTACSCCSPSPRHIEAETIKREIHPAKGRRRVWIHQYGVSLCRRPPPSLPVRLRPSSRFWSTPGGAFGHKRRRGRSQPSRGQAPFPAPPGPERHRDHVPFEDPGSRGHLPPGRSAGFRDRQGPSDRPRPCHNRTVLVDVGVSTDETGTLCGDVDVADVQDIVSRMTKSSLSLGAVTTSVLLRHTVLSAARRVG